MSPLVRELWRQDEANVIGRRAPERVVKDERLPWTQVDRDAAAVHPLKCNALLRSRAHGFSALRAATTCERAQLGLASASSVRWPTRLHEGEEVVHGEGGAVERVQIVFAG